MSIKIIAAKEFNHKTYSQMDNHVQLDQIVLSIIQKVREQGDAALYEYTKTFDKAVLKSLLVSEEEIETACNAVSADFIKALERAKTNITEFHAAQKEKSWFYTRENGVLLGQQVTPLDRAGIYIPGGKAAYPSTVLMNVIPAKLAGVEEIYITTPPQPDGSINPYVLAAAKLTGVTTIFKTGGAQAIAALAYGTETIPNVDKIVGPGNAYVARAKKWVYGDVAIDMIAGPSEICVVADETAPADFIAADLLSQAEHDEDASSICVTFSEELAIKIQNEINLQLEQLERKEIAAASIQGNGKIILADSIDEALNLVNRIAPEHLQLMLKNARNYVTKIKHAGAIFLGNYSPEPLGDYMAGPNHTLPTSSTARFASPLGVYDFIKRSSIIEYPKESLLDEALDIEAVAKWKA